MKLVQFKSGYVRLA